MHDFNIHEIMPMVCMYVCKCMHVKVLFSLFYSHSYSYSSAHSLPYVYHRSYSGISS